MTTTRPISPAQAYEEYYGPAIFTPLSTVLLEHLPLSPGERVLDLACGTGIVARRIAPLLGAAGQVVGVDINPGMIEVARAQAPAGGAPIEWRQGDATALDLPDGSFDVVVSQQALQFFSDRLAGLRHMRRVLTRDGRIALAVWRGVDHHALFAALADAEEPYLRELGAPVTRDDLVAPFSLGDAEELRGLLTDAGFRGIEIHAASIEARFPTPERFVERMELAYAAVVPQFAEDPAAFTAYLEAIGRATREIVERHRHDDHIVVPMHTHIAVAHA